MNLCVIPARGGSKRIPRKNIKLFAGNPIISYAINAAVHSGLFHRVIVTTDDDEIAKISRGLGADTPFKRPAELADDHTPTLPVIAHAISELQSGTTQRIDFVCCIYPAVPFVQIDDIRSGLELLKQSGANYTFPVAEFPSAIQRGLKRLSNGCLLPLTPQHELTRTQDLEPYFFDAGQFYWGRASTWLTTNKGLHSDSSGLIIPQWRVVDIDTVDDWKRAELIYRALFFGAT